MISLKDAVYSVGFTKIAGIKVPKDSMKWNEAILKQFYSEQSNIPKEMKSDVVVNNIDDKIGYAKGSVVVRSENNRKINFPVIIKNFELSPFDTFVDSKGTYISATDDNIMKSLSGEEVGKPEGKREWEATTVKTPGNTVPKGYRKLDACKDGCGAGGIKLAFDWKSTMNEADFSKFASIMLDIEDGDTHELYAKNPDLVTEIIDEGTHNRVVNKTDKEYKVDPSSIVHRMQTDVVTDAEMFDTSMLKQVKAPAAVTLRMGAKTMEDIMGAGSDMKDRLEVASSGVPIEGYVFKGDMCTDIFISKCGRYMAKASAFFAMKQSPLTNEVFTLDGRVHDEWSNRNPKAGFDKSFEKGKDSSEVYGIGDGGSNYGSHSGDMLVIFGADKDWKIREYSGPFTKMMVNGREVYRSNSKAVIKTNIAMPTSVSSVDDPIYKVTVGERGIDMIPELAIVANTYYMKNITSKLLKNTDSIKLAFDMSSLPKVDLSVGGAGIIVSGAPSDGILKVAGLYGKQLSAKDTKNVLYSLGMSKTASHNAVDSLIKSASNSLSVYGVNPITVDTYGVDFKEKVASIKPLLKEYADSIKVNLIKEAASIVDDPEAVDNVLSLNFINEDNILDYVNFTDELKETSNKLSEMLISSRVGLKDIDEAGTKKAIEGIEKVIQGLNKLKLVVGGSK